MRRDGQLEYTFGNGTSAHVLSFNYLLGRPRLRQIRTEAQWGCPLPQQPMVSEVVTGNFTCFRTFDQSTVNTSPMHLGQGLTCVVLAVVKPAATSLGVGTSRLVLALRGVCR